MFFNNSASNVGGAINVLAIDRSSLALRSISATGNAANMAVGSDDEEFIANTLRSEGGVLHVTGSDASVTITDSSLNNNRAGRVSWFCTQRQKGLNACTTAVTHPQHAAHTDTLQHLSWSLVYCGPNMQRQQHRRTS